MQKFGLNRCVRQWIMLGALCAMLLGGCALGTPTPEPVTITFAHINFDQEWYAALLQEFNKEYPHITVELKSVEPRDWYSQRGREGADVFAHMDWAMRDLVERGQVMELDAFVEQQESIDLQDFYPGVREHFALNGKTWAIPAGLDIMVLFYHQDLFDEYGVPYPQDGWTLQDFEQMLAGLRDPQTNVFGYAPIDLTLETLLVVYQHGGKLVDSLQTPTQVLFDEPSTIEALDWYFDLMHEYDLIPTPDEIRSFGGSRDSHVYYGFATGHVGSWIGELSQAGGRYWPSEWNMNWGMAALPRGANQATIAQVEGYFVSAETEHPEACWKWIEFLSRQIPERLAPTRKSIVESELYEAQVGLGVATMIRTSLAGELLMEPMEAPPALEADLALFGQAMQSIADGESTVEEAIFWIEQESQFK